MQIKAHVQTTTGYRTGWISATFEVADNASDDEIDKIVNEWALEQIDCYWERVEGSNEKTPSPS